MSWGCPSCTFINVEGKSKCEICETEAPESAYVKQETTQISHKEEEQEKKSPQKEKEIEKPIEKKVEKEPE